MSEVQIKRAYNPPTPDDGVRVLVDRLWPRGLEREGAKIDLWLKNVAPSPDLRRWFGHDPARWPGFQARYRAELTGSAELKELLATVERQERVTLLFGARDMEHNHALVLQAALSDIRANPPKCEKPQ